MSFRIRLEGADKAIAHIEGIGNFRWVERPLKQSALVLEAAMKVYPPAIPTSRYVRKGAAGLGGHWTTSDIIRIKGLMRIKVGNNLNYAPFVQSAQFQARIHRGRWITDRRAMETNLPRIRRFFADALARAVRG